MDTDIIKGEEKAISTVGDTWLAARTSTDEFREFLAETLAGETLSVTDLTRIKVPAGGATTWQYEDIDGEQTPKKINGVIVSQNFQRAYWAKDFSKRKEGDDPSPDCMSVDAIAPEKDRRDAEGNVRPVMAEVCDECPLSQWDSAESGYGQACKKTKRVFVLLEGSMLPVMVIVPPASLKAMRTYVLGLANQGKTVTDVISEFTLIKEKSAGGIDYSQIMVRKSDNLSKENAKRMKEYSRLITPVLQKYHTVEADTAA